MPPLRFLVDGRLRYRPQSANRTPICAHCRAGDPRTGWLIHERHELVREAGHGTANTDAAYVGAAADSRHPSPLGNVAVHYRAPASQLHDALWGAIHFGEVTLFVVPGSIATFMDRLAEQPGRTQLVVERNHGRQSSHLIEQVEHGFHEVVRLA